MNKNLIEQLNNWHELNEHNKIIQTIENLSKSELTYKLKNILGRAYNNLSEYDKAIEIFLTEKLTGANDALWNYRLGYAYFYNNEPQKALTYFQKSYELGDTTAKDFENLCLKKIGQSTKQSIESNTEDLDKKWFDFTIKFVEKLSSNNEDWNALSEKEQELAALWKLEMDMYNGGFIQFFCNWGYKCYLTAIRSLERMKAVECLNIIQTQYKIIQHLEDNKEIKELWDIPKFLTEEELTEISEVLDKKYWENKDNISEKTFITYSEFI